MRWGYAWIGCVFVLAGMELAKRGLALFGLVERTAQTEKIWQIGHWPSITLREVL